MATARTGWSRRSASYRSRLVGAGRSGKLSGTPMTAAETRAYWESGADLRSGRSHTPRPPAGAAPRDLAEQASVGFVDTPQWNQLARWRRRGPAWIPRSESMMANDTAAVLSQIDIPPSRWKHVEVVIMPGDRVVVTITPTRGYDRTVLLPDWDSWQETSRLIREPTTLSASKAEDKRLEQAWKNAHFSVNVTGTDTESRRGSPGPSPTKGPPPRPSSTRSRTPSSRRSTSSGGSAMTRSSRGTPLVPNSSTRRPGRTVTKRDPTS